ncbi:MAG TPA: peptide deformylase [Tepidisphaeraceae bacterium]|nr:peptide deformylase [Tepidisphaeraceae bacterium]
MAERVSIISYPDPRLKKVSAPITAFDAALKELTQQMFALMREEKGVGLAAPQVARNIRIFVMNATGNPEDDRVYVNPELSEAEGEEEGEEGCLSIPELRVKIFRSRKLRIVAKDLEGKPIDESADGYVARIWQHETDHLNGILLTDRMGPVAKIANRSLLKDLEEQYKKKQGKTA